MKMKSKSKRLQAKKSTTETQGSLLRDTRGLSTVEYLILLVVIAVAGITVWKRVATSIEGKANTAKTSLDSM